MCLQTSECVFAQNSFQEHRVNPAKAVQTAHTFSPEPPFPTLVMPLFHTYYSGAHAESHAQIMSISPFSRSDSEHSVYIEKILHIHKPVFARGGSHARLIGSAQNKKSPRMKTTSKAPARSGLPRPKLLRFSRARHIVMQARLSSNLRLPSNRDRWNSAPNDMQTSVTGIQNGRQNRAVRAKTERPSQMKQPRG